MMMMTVCFSISKVKNKHKYVSEQASERTKRDERERPNWMAWLNACFTHTTFLCDELCLWYAQQLRRPNSKKKT